MHFDLFNATKTRDNLCMAFRYSYLHIRTFSAVNRPLGSLPALADISVYANAGLMARTLWVGRGGERVDPGLWGFSASISFKKLQSRIIVQKVNDWDHQRESRDRMFTARKLRLFFTLQTLTVPHKEFGAKRTWRMKTSIFTGKFLGFVRKGNFLTKHNVDHLPHMTSIYKELTRKPT